MFVTVLFALQLALAPAGFAEAKALADANEKSLSAEMVSRLLEAQGKSLGAAVGTCARPGMDFSKVTVVFALNPDGSVAQTWREGGTPLALCLERELTSMGFPGTWPEPFFTSIELTLTLSQAPGRP